jgi:hypothetical protein
VTVSRQMSASARTTPFTSVTTAFLQAFEWQVEAVAMQLANMSMFHTHPWPTTCPLAL